MNNACSTSDNLRPGIDPSARVASTAILGAGVTIGANARISDGVRLGNGVVIGCNVVVERDADLGQGSMLDHNVVVRAGTKLGDGVVVAAGALLGQRPSRAKSSTLEVTADLAPLVIGEECQVGAAAILYAGTKIGSGCFIADGAQVRERCSLGRNVIIGHGATVENDCRIGDGTRIQTGAYITAHSDLAENVFIAPMVTTTNDNYVGRTQERFKHRKGATVERGGRVGGNAVLLPGVTVGQEALVGAGSVVTRDVPGYTVAMGVPARAVREVPGEQLLYPRTMVEPGTEPAGHIPVFDLTRQNAALSQELNRAITEVVLSGHYILGEQVKRLEESIAQLCGVRHAVGVANGSDALYLALLAYGIGPGDEVITTSFSFFATAGSIARTGATPVFCEIDPQTFNLNAAEIESLVTPRSRAIMPVHLYGQPADMDPILEVARRHGLIVIEDAAQALGAKYKGRPVGSLGNAACISFFPTKNLGAFGDAGMVVTDDGQVAERLRMLRAHGSKIKYHHELLGINSRLDALQAAILNAKLPHLASWTSRRRELSARYTELLGETPAAVAGLLTVPRAMPDAFHVYHQYTIRVKQREAVREHLKRYGVETTVYYPLPLHLQPVFVQLGYVEGSLPHAEAASREALSLPIFPELREEELERVVAAFGEFQF